MRNKEKTTINLVEDGVFPIVIDIDGNKIKKSLDTGLNVSGTIQGEGKLLGIPSLFIRTSGCNLRCAWQMADGTCSICDTAFASFTPDTNITEISDIYKLIRNNIVGIKHIVISGGEPMLQYKQIARLMNILSNKLKLHITIETNGTIFDPEVAEYTNLVSLSPKLSSSTPWQPNLRDTSIEYHERVALKHEHFRYNIPVIQAWIDSCYNLDPAYPYSDKKYLDRKPNKDFQLKFVVGSESDIIEIKEKYIRFLKGVEPFDIMLMPLGLNREQLEKTSRLVLRECVRNGWRYTPRLHIDIFNDKRSV